MLIAFLDELELVSLIVLPLPLPQGLDTFVRAGVSLYICWLSLGGPC